VNAPAARWHDVRATFADFAITTFAVEPRRLHRLLPEDCRPEIVSLSDGRERGLVSAVSFRARRFRLHGLPWLAFSFTQVNYRTYVRCGGEAAVWFFGTAIAAPWHVGPRLLWQLPWHGALIDIDARWSGAECLEYRLHQRSAGGDAELCAVAAPDAPGISASDDEACRLLTDPLIGHCRRLDGTRAAYRVWHPRIDARSARAETARFERFEDLGLVDRGQAPHSVLLERTVEFLVRLPPEAQSRGR
jgi:Uncharacterized conserved protein (COG2071)